MARCCWRVYTNVTSLRSALPCPARGLLQAPPVCRPIQSAVFFDKSAEGWTSDLRRRGTSAAPFGQTSSIEGARRGPGLVRAVAMDSSQGAGFKNREVMVQHILVPPEDEEKLYDLQKRVIRGEDFGDLATEYSICPSSIDGGMIGWVGQGRTVPEFEKAAFEAPLNKPVRIKTGFGAHLMMVLAERDAPIVWQMDPNELGERLSTGIPEEVQLVDVREPHEAQLAALPGFQLYPLSQFADWGPKIHERLDKSKETIVMCHHGVRSQQAAQWLVEQGFQNVHNVLGGINMYAMDVDPSVPQY